MSNSVTLINTICQLHLSDRYDAVNQIKDRFVDAGVSRDYDLQDRLQDILNQLPRNILDSTYKFN